MEKLTKESQSSDNTKTYIIGFLLSLGLTLMAYFLVTEKILQGWTLALTISALAIVQAIVQLLFFLHLGKESPPRWNLQVFLFMLSILVILVVGTLWIMANLDYQMMYA